MKLSARSSTVNVDWQPITVTVRDALDLVGIGRTHLYELIAAGRITTVKVGRRRLIHVASLKILVSGASAPLPASPAVQLPLFAGGEGEGERRKEPGKRKRGRQALTSAQRR